MQRQYVPGGHHRPMTSPPMGVARADQLGPARTPKSTSGNKRQAVAAAPGALDEAPGKAEPKKSSKPRRKSDGKSKSKGADAGDLELPPTGSDDFTIEVAHMMFVFGDCRRKMTEEQKPVLLLVSSIVRQYCLELVGEALKLAHLRGSPSISVDDLVWGLRHDRRKILRVAMFLDRRELEKQAEEGSKGKGGSAAARDREEKSKKSLDKKLMRSFMDYVADPEGEAEEARYLREYMEMGEEVLKQLPAEEQRLLAESRKVTFRGKRFREWALLPNHQLSGQVSEEVLELLAFIAWEYVGTITQGALLVKRELEGGHPDDSGLGVGQSYPLALPLHVLPRTKKKVNRSKTPLTLIHIHEANRRLCHERQRSGVGISCGW